MAFLTEHFLGTMVNFVIVAVTGVLGTLVKKGVPKSFTDSIMYAVSICVVYVGIDGLLAAAPEVPEGCLLSSGLFKVLVMIISMALGTLVGELIDFDKLLNKLGEAVSKKMGKFGDGNFARGFVTCSLLFCVGAMSVNGAMLDAQGDPTILLAKAVIDGIACFVLASSLGIGCAFSALFLLVYQGAITLLSIGVLSVVSAETVAYMSATGSLIVILVGTNVLGATKVKTANMVPAMFLAIGVEALLKLIFF